MWLFRSGRLSCGASTHTRSFLNGQIRSPRFVFSELERRAMSTFATVVGLAAAVCTTGANLPQLKKAWTTGQTDDISMNMLLVLASGLALWVAYGVLQNDFVIILANAISLALIGGLVCLKLLQTSS